MNYAGYEIFECGREWVAYKNGERCFSGKFYNEVRDKIDAAEGRTAAQRAAWDAPRCDW